MRLLYIILIISVIALGLGLGLGLGLKKKKGSPSSKPSAPSSKPPAPAPHSKPSSPSFKLCTGKSSKLSPKQCKAWQNFWDSTDGSHWAGCNSSSSKTDPCSCGSPSMSYNITCSPSGTSITNLTLDQNQLTGTIPSSISALTDLQFLDLYQNKLTGTIPSSISVLTDLQVLVLPQNKLTGSIPSSISALTQLVNCDLTSQSSSFQCNFPKCCLPT